MVLPPRQGAVPRCPCVTYSGPAAHAAPLHHLQGPLSPAEQQRCDKVAHAMASARVVDLDSGSCVCPGPEATIGAEESRRGQGSGREAYGWLQAVQWGGFRGVRASAEFPWFRQG
eukprot:7637606-Lingulodinium_polyedra.AAC.1